MKYNLQVGKSSTGQNLNLFLLEQTIENKPQYLPMLIFVIDFTAVFQLSRNRLSILRVSTFEGKLGPARYKAVLRQFFLARLEPSTLLFETVFTK